MFIYVSMSLLHFPSNAYPLPWQLAFLYRVYMCKNFFPLHIFFFFSDFYFIVKTQPNLEIKHTTIGREKNILEGKLKPDCMGCFSARRPFPRVQERVVCLFSSPTIFFFHFSFHALLTFFLRFFFQSITYFLMHDKL